MLNLTLSVLLQTTLVSAAPNTDPYAQAYHESARTGKPLVVLIGADWCPACRTMKGAVIPQVQAQGGLDDVEFVQLNTDGRNAALAQKMMRGGSIPQLVLYERTNEGGWRRHQLTGGQSAATVRSFIAQRSRPLVSNASTGGAE